MTLHFPTSLFVLFHILFSTSFCVSWNGTVGEPVNTTSGMIFGHADQRYPKVSEYLGIPFAHPPIGDLRFAPPNAYYANRRINADTQPPSCPQSASVRNESAPEPEQNIDASKASFADKTSEDCLYLNIWTKSPNSRSGKRPVLVWFYGGGFHAGGASDDTEQGGIFAEEQNVVMVNFNYRLGIFGFSGAPGLTQNVGLLDQRLAIEWVRNNIEAFGGDVERITVIGHSAGAASVDYYTYAWYDDPIIAGAIPMSGTATSFGHRTLQTGMTAWTVTAGLLGCGSSSSTSNFRILECMRQQDTHHLHEASLTAGMQVAKTLSKEDQIYVGITGIYSPTIDNKTIFSNYTNLGRKGTFIKVPVMTGHNIDEACLFSQKGQIPVKDDPLVTEAIFSCPIQHAASFRASIDVPAWEYRWFGAYPNEEFPVCPGRPWHGSEVAVMFGSTAIAAQGVAATQQEESNGRYFRQSVAAFARNPRSGLKTEMHWPEIRADSNLIIDLAKNQTEMSVGQDHITTELCDITFRYGGPNY